ncbi:MAG: hypothetical protein JO328_19915 [Hyphomicrobiales bacterium]|nr:hypothetical protein [Hyphomicrobiales bacterium]MBV9428792.1 hypothetical protein [Bradyrhizobiaceae bacterium]
MGTTAEFRDYAQQCIAIARKTNNRTLRETMLEMAETWLGLAGASRIEFEHVRGNGAAADGIGPGPDAA